MEDNEDKSKYKKKGKDENYFTFNNSKIYVAPKLRHKLDSLVREIKEDEDAVILIFGNEGTGKSKLARQVAGYFSHKFNKKFNIDNIHFTSQEYIQTTARSSKYTTHIFDEARRDVGKSNRGKEKDTFHNYLSECRDDNQIHIIVLPAFSDISEYIALHRAKCIIKTQKKKDKKTGKERKGYFRMLKTKRKQDLFKMHEKKYSQPLKRMVSEMMFFSREDVVDEEKYKLKKRKYKQEKYVEQSQTGGEEIKMPKSVIEFFARYSPKQLVSQKEDSKVYTAVKRAEKQAKEIFSQ